ncbi:hypothetical protein Emed_002442 [Eimeria media]
MGPFEAPPRAPSLSPARLSLRCLLHQQQQQQQQQHAIKAAAAVNLAAATGGNSNNDKRQSQEQQRPVPAAADDRSSSSSSSARPRQYTSAAAATAAAAGLAQLGRSSSRTSGRRSCVPAAAATPAITTAAAASAAGLGYGGTRSRTLSDHALLQQLQRGQETSPAECLVLLPEESQLKGFQLDRVFLETHVLQQTAYPNLFVNLRGQEIERRGDELITSLGFRAKVSVSILREERMFESGCAFSCLLVSSPLLPLPPGRRGGEAGAPSVSSRRPQGGPSTGGAPQGPPVSAEDAVLSSLSSTETQLRVERLWKQGPQGPVAERLVHAEIMRFKNTHVLVPGFDAALAQRVGQLITACCRQVPSTLAPAKEVYRLLERFVWLEIHDRLWPFFLEAGEAQQAALERGLEAVRMDPASAATDLGLRRELRGVVPTQAGRELMKLPSLLLPHEKLQQLSLVVQKIYEACDAAVAAANSRAPVGLKQRQPVEVACDDLVALLVLAVADSGGEALVASYLHMSVLLLQQERAANKLKGQKPFDARGEGGPGISSGPLSPLDCWQPPQDTLALDAETRDSRAYREFAVSETSMPESKKQRVVAIVYTCPRDRCACRQWLVCHQVDSFLHVFLDFPVFFGHLLMTLHSPRTSATRGAPSNPSAEGPPPSRQHHADATAADTQAAAAGSPPRAATAAAEAAAKPAKSKKQGDPERRKEYSIHALVRKISSSNKSPAPADVSSPAAAAAAAAAAAKETVAASQAAEGPPQESNDELSLFMFDFGECDAKRCSGRRLLRHAKLNKITPTGRVVYAQRAGGRSSSSNSSSSSSSKKRLDTREGDGDRDSSSDSDSSSSEGEADAESEEAEEAHEDDRAASSLPAPAATAATAAAAAGKGGGGELVRVRVKGGRFRGILLTPYFDSKTQIFSRADAQVMRQHGLAVVDCSWNGVLEGRRSHPIAFVKQNVRVLPLLLCANPTHYGAPNILTCAEALAGALYIAGYRRHADLLLSSFTWGAHFLVLNERFLKLYVPVSNGQAMRALKEQQEQQLQQEAAAAARQKQSNTQGGDYAAVYSAVTAAETVSSGEKGDGPVVTSDLKESHSSSSADP